MQSAFNHLSLHCRIEDQDDCKEEEDEDVVGGGGQAGQVDLQECLRHCLAQNISCHAAVDTWWWKLNIETEMERQPTLFSKQEEKNMFHRCLQDELE